MNSVILINSLMLLISSAILMVSTHPVSFLCAIMIQSLLICSQLWMHLKISWLSFILFLIFLGGLMVIFVYIVSLAANEKFELKFSSSYNFVLFYATTAIFSTSMYFFYKEPVYLSKNLFSSTLMIFSEASSISTSLIMFYLLFTLIVAIKISSKTEGPLRNFIK